MYIFIQLYVFYSSSFFVRPFVNSKLMVLLSHSISVVTLRGYLLRVTRKTASVRLSVIICTRRETRGTPQKEKEQEQVIRA